MTDLRKFHVSLEVTDIAASVEDYSKRLNQQPERVIEDAYALWRTPGLNFSIRKGNTPGRLRHVGWEEETAAGFTVEKDVNGLEWEHFSCLQQQEEIEKYWPSQQAAFGTEG